MLQERLPDLYLPDAAKACCIGEFLHIYPLGFFPHLTGKSPATIDRRRFAMQEKIDSSMIGPAEVSLFRSGDQIKDDVCELLAENPFTIGRDIRVSVSDGVVLLEGHVESDESRDAASFISLEVLGVTAVRNELEIDE